MANDPDAPLAEGLARGETEWMDDASSWASDDFPILEAIAERNAAGIKPDVQTLCDVTGSGPTW